MLAACLLLAACNDDSCYDNGSSLPLASLYMGKTQQVIPQLTVKGIGAPGDSLLADATTVSEIYLPLRASVNTTSFAFSHPLNDEIVVSDTLTIGYQPIAFFHSKECGPPLSPMPSSLPCASISPTSTYDTTRFT